MYIDLFLLSKMMDFIIAQSGNLFSGIISGFVVALAVGVLGEIKKERDVSKSFNLECLNIIDKFRVKLNKDLNVDLLVEIIKENKDNPYFPVNKKEEIIKEMKKVIELKEKVDLRDLNTIRSEYLSISLIRKNIFKKEKKDKMNYVYDELDKLICLIRYRSYDFEEYIENEKVVEKNKSKENSITGNDSICNMFYFLSEIYIYIYERRNVIKDGRKLQLYYNIWAYNIENEVLSLNIDNAPSQKLSELNNFLVFCKQ